MCVWGGGGADFGDHSKTKLEIILLKISETLRKQTLKGLMSFLPGIVFKPSGGIEDIGKLCCKYYETVENGAWPQAGFRVSSSKLLYRSQFSKNKKALASWRSLKAEVKNAVLRPDLEFFAHKKEYLNTENEKDIAASRESEAFLNLLGIVFKLLEKATASADLNAKCSQLKKMV